MHPETKRLLESEDARVRGVYAAGPTGFNEAGRLWHHQVVVPKLEAAGLLVLSPWMVESAITEAEEKFKDAPFDELRQALSIANLTQGRLDLQMVRTARAILACFDGAHVDDGTAMEVGYALGYLQGLLECGRQADKLIVGVRTDMRRSADNDGSIVNLMLETACVDSGGVITQTLDEAVGYLAERILPTGLCVQAGAWEGTGTEDGHDGRN